MTRSRAVAATCELVFRRGGDGRTVLSAQHVQPPFAVLGTFRLDALVPGFCTVVLQSTCGPLRPGDELMVRVIAEAGAQCAVTSQAALVVHAGAATAVTRCAIDAADDAWCEVVAPPTLLAYGARLENLVDVEAASGATVVVTDAYAPAGLGASAYELESTMRVHRARRLLALDRLVLDTRHDSIRSAGVLGDRRAHGTLWAIGFDERLDVAGLALGSLPNGTGIAARAVERDGHDVSMTLRAAWAAVRRAGLGIGVNERLVTFTR
jgi:urease accessory protein UreH